LTSKQAQIQQHTEDEQRRDLEKKIDAIAYYNSKHYFNKRFKKVALTISENANTICEYIKA
jgi:hypothetical protein